MILVQGEEGHSPCYTRSVECFVMGFRLSRRYTIVFLVFCSVIFSGCSGSTGFTIKDIAKTNIDKVSEIHLQASTDYIKNLTTKLYKRNPSELRKLPGETIESRLEAIFQCPVTGGYEELEYKTGTEAMLLGFDTSYNGDRVFAVMYGLYTMVLHSYNNKCELYLLDTLSEQGLYNSARNIEILAWRLSNKRKEDGSLFLLTNSMDTTVTNLSYERLFGKLIATQDSMAVIVSGQTGRMIKEVVQFAGMAFLPIPI